MSWSVDWDGGFVVGGDGGQRLTPNFRLREFQRTNGSVRVHRELVSALQILRDRIAKPLSISGVDEDGLGATITGVSAADVMQASRARPTQLFAPIEDAGTSVHVRIADPQNAVELELAEALETAFLVTSAFETGGDKFQQITGNFDGAGLSFGPVQMNFGSGTLVPLFRKFKDADENALQTAFSDPDDYAEWLKVLDMDRAKQIAWANNISTGRSRADVVEPWKTYFHNVGKVERFRAIMVQEALRQYGKLLMSALKYIQSLRPGVVIDHLRCMCSLWDLVIQQGSLDKAKAAIEARVHGEQPADQFHLLKICVEERGKAASTASQSDCVSRRVGVLHGVPETVGEVQRANVMFYMLRDARVKGATDLDSVDIDAEVARASDAIATGTSV